MSIIIFHSDELDSICGHDNFCIIGVNSSHHRISLTFVIADCNKSSIT